MACSKGKARKHFFFEKKKQKTFGFLNAYQINKSFLVLFFKKELLSFACLLAIEYVTGSPAAVW
jgi:hypothetical protein